jgi:hypothetical protein
MRPFDVAERDPFPRPPAMSRLTTVLNGRHIATTGEAPRAVVPDPEHSRHDWRRFVQMLNLRGESFGDE